MNEVTVGFSDEFFQLIKELAKRYRATPQEIVQLIVMMELASMEELSEADTQFLDLLNPDERTAK